MTKYVETIFRENTVKPELSIELDYLKDRNNPAEIFEAMASYINAYQDLGQLLSSSIGLDESPRLL